MSMHIQILFSVCSCHCHKILFCPHFEDTCCVYILSLCRSFNLTSHKPNLTNLTSQIFHIPTLSPTNPSTYPHFSQTHPPIHISHKPIYLYILLTNPSTYPLFPQTHLPIHSSHKPIYLSKHPTHFILLYILPTNIPIHTFQKPIYL